MSDFNAFAASLFSSPSVKSYLGDEITITHGGHTSEAITAEVFRNPQVIDEAQGTLIKWNGATFKLDAADLVINGSQVKPVEGMRIALGTEVFEISPPPGNEQCFQPLASGLRLLIYAKQVG